MKKQTKLFPLTLVVLCACGEKGQSGSTLTESTETTAGEESGGGAVDPLNYYGPCDNPDCGLGSGASILDLQTGGCVCVVPCEDAAACPTPDAWTGSVSCIDDAQNGMRCALSCTVDMDCPTGTTACLGGECVF